MGPRDVEPQPEEEPIAVTARDEEVAYEILKKPPPWDRSPLQHVARIVARYRQECVRSAQRS